MGVNLKDYIKNLYDETISQKEYQKQIDDFIYSDYDYDKWRKELFEIEKKIGGIGVHNANTFFLGDENHATGNYRGEDRSIFRPIQYCTRVLLENFIDSDTRYLINMSCAHIEGLLKRIYMRLRNLEEDFRPMGNLIVTLKTSTIFNNDNGEDLMRISTYINEAYRKSKHDFEIPIEEYQEALDLDTHLHSYEEAMVIYFGCRIHGISLMELMKNIDMYPDSMKELYMPDYTEFEKITAVYKHNLEVFHPGISKGGKKWLKKNWNNPDI